jgi:hypothetical protein
VFFYLAIPNTAPDMNGINQINHTIKLNLWNLALLFLSLLNETIVAHSA